MAHTEELCCPHVAGVPIECCLPVGFAKEGASRINDAGVAREAQVQKHDRDAELGQLPRDSEAVGQLIVAIATDVDAVINLSPTAASLIDGCADALVVLDGTRRRIGGERLPPTPSSGQLALASTRTMPARPSISHPAAMSQFGVFAPALCISRQSRSASQAGLSGGRLGPKLSRRASLGFEHPRGMNHFCHGARSEGPSRGMMAI